MLKTCYKTTLFLFIDGRSQVHFQQDIARRKINLLREAGVNVRFGYLILWGGHV